MEDARFRARAHARHAVPSGRCATWGSRTTSASARLRLPRGYLFDDLGDDADDARKAVADAGRGARAAALDGWVRRCVRRRGAYCASHGAADSTCPARRGPRTASCERSR